jgi:capsid portal protein
VKGVDQEAVRTSVEQSLRNNGLVVYETFSPDEDGLFLVTVTDRKVHGGGYLYDISGKLLEPVHLKRTGAKLVSVETWSESVLGDATDDNASANLNKSITRIMDVFAADYAKDNAEAKHG